MCLERCNFTSEEIAEQLQQLEDHIEIFNAISFEMFNLGPNSQLVINNFTQVGPRLRAMGLETYPMISSYPYPPNFIDWMRELFASPLDFIEQVVQQYDNRTILCDVPHISFPLLPPLRKNILTTKTYCE
jgi:hypothetical protein